MAYAVKEIFYTLQGEGVHSGRPAVFLRMSGCNLWNGRQEDRAIGNGSCSTWCDTDFLGTDGTGGGKFPDASALACAVSAHWPGDGKRFVVCTGGEPLLQLDAPLIEALHDRGFELAVETNGTQPAPPGIDWICMSPKAGTELKLTAGNELKFVFPQPGLEPAALETLAFEHFLLQPLDGPAQLENTQLALDYCLKHPLWRLSLQTHKLVGIR
ncbi:MAG: 7-carboxy-7-deazaguanine synthase [Deltaproteobacteria bacterium]|nr:7-carboxy-7-deazaguanine synthase [Deltaproteobacteria bacterium]